MGDINNDEEEALKWAALQKLPTYNRMRTAIITSVKENGQVMLEEIDVTKLGFADRQQIMLNLLQANDHDNERFLRKLRDRIDKVGISLPKIEVRFEHLSVDADIYVGSRALPTLFNYAVNRLEELLGYLHLSPSKKQVLDILKDVSGIIKPSRLTLVLGPPNSGKTTLLKALAGKLDSGLRVTGNVTYNGHEFKDFIPQRTAAYISQTDLHIAELTVRETLDFSGRCQGVGYRHEMLMELCKREKEAGIKPDPDIDAFMKAYAVEGQETTIVTDYVLKILGLDGCANTRVGDQMRRGISGGQKKRLTTGEMLVGPAKALFMDEISTGLDSSTTYQIVKYLRQTVQISDATIVVSLLQPAPEVYGLFDDLVLIAGGHIIYQGPCSDVLQFFESIGFTCPHRKGVADFLQEVTSKKDQEQYWADQSMPYRYISAEEFSNAFTDFKVGQLLSKELKLPYDKAKSHPAALVRDRYGLSRSKLLLACLSREWILMKRNSFIYVFKTAQMAVMAAICMTMFLRTQHQTSISDGNTLMGALFYSLVIVMFNGLAELSLTISRLPVLYKQRDLLFYPAWVFSLPTWVMRMPFSFLESFIWVFLTYWVIGFAPDASRFFKQFLLLFCVHNMAMGLFRFIGSLGRSLVVANTFGSAALLVLFVLSGFIISRDKIDPWWIWGYWISPMMYGENGLAVNEFLAPRWNYKSNSSSASTVGVTILKSRGIFPKEHWYWIGIGALIGYSIFFNIVFTLAITFLNPLGKPQATVTEELGNENQANDKLKQASNALQEEVDTAKGMVLPFQPLSIAFRHIDYYVDMPLEMKQKGEAQARLQLLRDVSGVFRPGVLTALVGISGAGKTTLMDVLAGRKTGGYIEGTINISGYPKKQETFARISGYCEQTDIHSPNVTVHESLIYSSWLRLPNSVDKDTRMMFVEEVMELVELTTLKDALVGLPGITGLSVEQRKRLTIAVELVANPSIIFMDEPTSGLDARAAAIVMRTVRNTVDTGRTVVCTIHQPSIDIFEAFDELMLMKRGGQLIYAGPLGRHSKTLIDYFEAFEGIPKIVDGYNPATWMLEVTSESIESRLGIDFAEFYQNSFVYRSNEALISELSSPTPGSADLHFPTKYAQSFTMQCWACLWKQHRSYWKNPHYNLMRLVFTTLCALLFGTIFWNKGSHLKTSQDVLNIMGSMYAAVLFVGVHNSSGAQPVVGIERTVFYRERAAGLYSEFPYAFGQVLIEFPYVFVQTVVYLVIVYSMIAYQWSLIKFLWFLFFMYTTFLYFTFYGMMVVGLTPNLHVSAILTSAFYGLWNLFSGFLIHQPKMPVWWRWYSWLDPVAWTLNGLVSSQFGDLTETISITDEPDKSIKHYIKDEFGCDKDLLGAALAVHIGLVVLFASIFAFSIKNFNFQKR